MNRARFLVLMAGLALLAPVVGLPQETRAPAVGPRLEPIARAGDRIGSLQIKPTSAFFVGSLNDQGRVTFVAESVGGGQLLLQATGNQVTPIVAPGSAAPHGQWSRQVGILSPVSTNADGDAVFAADLAVANQASVGTFRWHAASGLTQPLALSGMAAVQNLTYAQGGGPTPVINDHGDVAMVAGIRIAGGPTRNGVFMLDRHDQLQPVALPEGELPDGGKILFAWLPSLNTAGVVATVVRARNAPIDSIYLWEKGTLSRLPPPDREALKGRHLAGFTGVWVNDHNRSVLLSAFIHSLSGSANAPFRWAEGKAAPVALPGQPMPGGGRFQTIQPQDPLQYQPSLATGISAANSLGQHAFLARLEGGATAAYLMDADGSVSLLLKSGMETSLGKISAVGGRSQGIGLNDQGQVALALKPVRGPETVVLLTPQ